MSVANASWSPFIARLTTIALSISMTFLLSTADRFGDRLEAP
ncbi:MAG TPA: hypothetical protein VFC71_00335 [Candidatus Polarisedimenticolia bacterium]|nr:hypothetical protein [Candidatus Polarisedimenticolia bacterium]